MKFPASSTLRPCPFCGGREFVVGNDHQARRVWLFVECTGCYTRGPLVSVPYADSGKNYDTGEAMAHERWNARIVPVRGKASKGKRRK